MNFDYNRDYGRNLMCRSCGKVFTPHERKDYFSYEACCNSVDGRTSLIALGKREYFADVWSKCMTEEAYIKREEDHINKYYCGGL